MNLNKMNKELAANTNLSHYRIVSKIGAGGMGEVFLAEDTRLRRKIALKILPADLSGDKDRLRRFEQEAFAASALNHPNILTIYEFGAENGVHFLASEFIAGETLRERLQRQREPLSLREVLDIAAQVAAALDAAHQSGIVHRDIKPENIMLREADGLIKVLDFGLAKLTEKKTAAVDTEGETRAQVNTAPGMVMGTAAYMSPEQARGKETDARSDIWGLGVIVYEMLTGRTPFAGETTTDTLAAILHREPAPISRLVADVPQEIERIINKTLKKDCDERFQTAKDLLIDLKAARQNLEFQNKFGVPPSGDIKQTEAQTEILEVNRTDEKTSPRGGTPNTTSSAEHITGKVKKHRREFALASLVLLFAAIGLGYWFFSNRVADTRQIESIAVLPFVNESGNVDVEYLSDGMTETLISSLSQIPKLNVKARSSVFRYKGKETNAQTIGKELNVQAILNGRVVQRGQDLILYVELVDAQTENSLWKQTYNKTMTNLVALQSDIARDVADKLRVKLSGADEQKLAKNYTANAEAYQLYLKGRYHLLKLQPSETQKAISFYQQAIAIDPNYALAYVGLASAYRSLAVAGEMPATEFFPKAKAAATKAIEIDDTLAEAYAALGYVIFRYDWNWNEAENKCERALELDPNSAEAHETYAHLLSSTARHAEALAEIKRARELDPLNLRIGVVEAQFLIYAGQADEALFRSQKIFELDPDFSFAHSFASSAYIEKGMYPEAIAEARKGRVLSGGRSHAIAFEGYALAKTGKQAEARAVLDELLKLSTERYVPPYPVALVYNGLGERDKTLEWLEKGYQHRDARMMFLKVEPKWNNLRDDPRFQELLRKLGFPQ